MATRVRDPQRRERLSVETILRRSFWDSLKEYRHHGSLATTHFTCLANDSWLQRIIPAIIKAVAFAAILYYLHFMWTATLDRPLIMNLESSEYPIEHINFPAVAICNVNRISKRALAQFAADVYKELPDKRYSQKQLERALLNFGRLIDFSYNESLSHDWLFQWMMEKYRLESNNIVSIMKKLAPNCEEMLLRCAWAGEIVDCSSIIIKSRTANCGYCCTFNYVLNYTSATRPVAMNAGGVKTQTTAGMLHGLLVIYDAQLDDYAYPVREIQGFDVLLFDALHYADPNAGRLVHRIAQPKTSVFIEIKATQQLATKEIRKYKVKTRKCRFRDELFDKFYGMYSFSACLVNCKVTTISSLCKCVPFFYATNKNFLPYPVCTFEDLKCLNKYKEKLYYYYPYGAQDLRGLETELEDSLHCVECWPDCELTQYAAKSYAASLSDTSDTKTIQSTILQGINATGGLGMLAIYHATHDARLIRLDVVFYWYEIISNFGGFCGIMIGFSIMCIAEIVYFFTIRYVHNFINNYTKYH